MILAGTMTGELIAWEFTKDEKEGLSRVKAH
jgi:hypothetical protein